MYSDILFCLDNSAHSGSAVELGLSIASRAGASATGLHVYAARLHDERFRDMESGLPPEYQDPQELARQREIHATLIEKGLRIISDSYATVFLEKARLSGVKARAVSREGKNYEEILKEAAEGHSSLVVMGAQGLGSTGSGRLGSVCARAARRLEKDLLVARPFYPPSPAGRIIAAVDGSPLSFGALKSAVFISKALGLEVEAVSVFDPYFHQTAFRSIASVLSDEAGRVFKFAEQEKLHDEVIDKGLAKIYSDHLETAKRAASALGADIKTTLIAGKAADALVGHAARTNAFMITVGRTGVHSTGALDIGSVTEAALRELGCSVLVSSTPHHAEAAVEKDIKWDDASLELLSRVPDFVRGVAKRIVEENARVEGIHAITPEFMTKVRKKMGL